MEREPHEVALRAWLVAALDGVTVIYSPQPVNVEPPARPYATLRAYIADVEGADDDVIHRNTDENGDPLDEGEAEVVHRMHGFGEASVSIYADDPRGLVADLRASRHAGPGKVALDESGLVVRRIGAARDIPEQRGTEWFRRVTVEVEFAFSEERLTRAIALEEANAEFTPAS